MPQCCAFGCFNRNSHGGNKQFHRLPGAIRNGEIRKVWIQRIGRKNWTASDNSRLCSDHFSEDQYEQNRQDGKKKLKPNAVPNRFAHKPAPKQRKPPAKRHRPETDKADACGDNQYEQNRQDEMKKLKPNAVPNQFANNQDLKQLIPPAERHRPEIDKADACGDSAAVPCVVEQNFDVSASATGASDSHADCRRKLDLAQKEARKQKQRADELESNISALFNDDELRFLSNGSMRGFTWSDDTIQKALKIRASSGPTGYAVLRELGYPLPCERVLYGRFEGVKFAPSILYQVLNTPSLKVQEMKAQEHVEILQIDQISISQSLESDLSIEPMMEKPTVAPSTEDQEESAGTI